MHYYDATMPVFADEPPPHRRSLSDSAAMPLASSMDSTCSLASSSSSSSTASSPSSSPTTRPRRSSQLRRCESVRHSRTTLTPLEPHSRQLSRSLTQLDAIRSALGWDAAKADSNKSLPIRLPVPLLIHYDMEFILNNTDEWPEKLRATLRAGLEDIARAREEGDLRLRQKHAAFLQSQMNPRSRLNRDQQHSNLVDLAYRLLSRLQLQQIALLTSYGQLAQANCAGELAADFTTELQFRLSSLKQHFQNQRKSWNHFPTDATLRMLRSETESEEKRESEREERREREREERGRVREDREREKEKGIKREKRIREQKEREEGEREREKEMNWTEESKAKVRPK
ncbi:uncharacterized protein MONBRDRAFT_32231 [Monosiga brevicollis MX1]|uniref:Uncharacterized protein n=1 Tax=Monosiga brevicollis TaxID=81824 RepID=A9UXK9_MONBE|nr:uncharacterized protein MONBRDRAFT_32231 [Monosiga brevicollis MX1]EDQ90027.1 predicted protein [Monosiga brevicollis MX1]|eukprot:XP_001745449.1 hypothetical protein [Monosiga brevicollis MX1]